MLFMAKTYIIQQVLAIYDLSYLAKTIIQRRLLAVYNIN